MIRRSLIVSAFAIANSGIAFLGQIVAGYFFGTTAEMDAYLAGSTLPAIAVGIVGASTTFLFVPAFSAIKIEGESNQLAPVILPFLKVGCFALALIAGLLLVFAPAIIAGTAPGLGDKAPLAIQVYSWSWMIAILSLPVGVFTAANLTEERFVPAVVSVSLVPIGTMIAASLFSSTLGVMALVLGAVVGTVAQLVWLGWPLRLRWVRGFKVDRRLRESLVAFVPLAVFLLPHTSLYLIDRYLAAGLEEGAISYIAYANRIAIAIAAFVSLGASTVAFPSLARDIAASRPAQALKTVERGTILLVCAMIPIVIGVQLFGRGVISMLFERGSFTAVSTNGTFQVLSWFAYGAVGMVAVNFLNRAVFVLRPKRFMVLFGLSQVAVYLLLSTLLVGRYGFVAMGMAYAVVWLLGALGLFLFVRGRLLSSAAALRPKAGLEVVELS